MFFFPDRAGHRWFVPAAVLILLVIGNTAFSQNVLTVSDITAYALENSREIRKAREEVREAGETISEVFTLNKSSLSVSSGYNYVPAAGPTDSEQPAQQQTQSPVEHTVSVDAGVTIPIVPELSVSAGLSNTFLDDKDNVTANIRLNYSPFGDPSTEWQEWETLRKAQIKLANLQQTVPMNAETAALNLAKGRLELQAAERAMELADREYEISKKRYDLEDITYAELEEFRADAGTSRQAYYNSLKSLLSLKKSLYQIVGPNLGDIEVSALSTDDVLLLVRERETNLEAAGAYAAATVALLNLAVETEALKRRLKATPVFRPSLSLTGTMNFNSFRTGAGVSLTLSPDQFQHEERNELSEAIADKEADLVLEQANVTLEVRMAEQSISVAREALDISIKDYTNAEIQNRESQLLHERGERTDLELERSNLSLFSASIRVFSSAVDLYANLGDLLRLYLLD